MKNIFVIFVKELKRVFTDKRMLLSLFLPGVLIFALYSLMGSFMSSNVFANKTKDTAFEVAYTDNYGDTTNKPLLIQTLEYAVTDGNSVNPTMIETAKFDEYKEKLINKEIHLLVKFSDNFEVDILDNSKKASNYITLLYNGESEASSELYTTASACIQTAYVNYLQNIENGNVVPPNVGTKDNTAMRIMSFVFPMLTISILFSTVASLCPETIAGEKERGTLASLLLTPIKRRHFVLGKVLALSLMALASGAVTFLGTLFSLPKIMGAGGELTITLAPLEISLLFLVIVSTLLFFIGIGIIISAISNTIKEATGYLAPFMVIFMLLGIIPASIGTNIGFAFVPVLNLSVSMHAIFMGTGNIPLLLGITVISNIVYATLTVLLIAKLFEKERVVLGQ